MMEAAHPIAELIKQHGYPFEVYPDILTEDGYILTAYRIPHGKLAGTNEPKPVVLLMHGVISNCADYLLVGPERALGFLLSDSGYDVWLANSRGRKVSSRHITYNHDKDQEYWKFSFHEMGVYDLPALFNKIEEVTGLKTVTFIGHSQGAILPFVLNSERPEYNERFNLVIALNPVAIVQNMKSIPYQILSVTRHVWMQALEKSGKLQVFPSGVHNVLSTLIKRYGQGDNWFFTLVVQLLFLLNGRTPQQFVKEYLIRMLEHYPDTTSVVVLKHFDQTYRSGTFRKFDHGREQNLRKYGTPEPPPYDLNKVVCPAALFSSSGDLVAPPQDVLLLRQKLPNCVAYHEIEDPKFNHSDFLYGRYSVEVVYPYIFDHVREFSQVK